MTYVRPRAVAWGGMLSALGWLFLIFSGALPTGRLVTMTLASWVVAIAWREWHWKGAFLVYLAVSLLGLIWPGWFVAVMFALCFGLLPLLTLFLCPRMPRWLARTLIHVVMTGLFLAGGTLIGFESMFHARADGSMTVVLIVAIAVIQLFLFVYDYAFRAFERFYEQRIAPWVHRRA